jgi:ribonuclease VapC
MIYVDASALVAMILGEPESTRFCAILAELDPSEAITSPVAIYEAVAGVARSRACSIADARALVDDLVEESAIRIVEITPRHGEIAISALERFGKGRHPAALNMGDCFGYAVAEAARSPILFKGDDFSRTDLTDGSSL